MADPSMPWTHPPSSLFGGCLPIIPHGRAPPPPPHIWDGEAGSSSSPHMNEERVVVVVITPHIIPMLTYINASWLFVFVHIDLVPILWGNTFVFILLCFGSILKQTLTHEIHH
jgi:hypothetical protein